MESIKKIASVIAFVFTLLIPTGVFASSAVYVTGSGNQYAQISYASGDILLVTVTNALNNNQNCGNSNKLSQALVVTDDANASTTMDSLNEGSFSQTGNSSGGCVVTHTYTHVATTTGVLGVTTTSAGSSPTNSYISLDVFSASSGGSGTSTATTTINVSTDFTPFEFMFAIILWLAVFFASIYLVKKLTD